MSTKTPITLDDWIAILPLNVQKHIKGLETALEFYGDGMNYEGRPINKTGEMPYHDIPEIEKDKGQTAREALGRKIND